MDIKRKRITRGILALLAATLIACGSVDAGSAGHRGNYPGGGDTYLTADSTYGLNLRNPNSVSSGPSVAPSEALAGPQFQP